MMMLCREGKGNGLKKMMFPLFLFLFHFNVRPFVFFFEMNNNNNSVMDVTFIVDIFIFSSFFIYERPLKYY